MEEFGEKLRSLRKEKELTIRKLGELSGVAHSYLSQVETGKRGIPKIETLEKIANGLDIPSIDLLVLAGYLPNEKAGYNDVKEKEVEIRSLPETLFDDLDYLLSSDLEIFFKGKLLSKLQKTKLKRLIEIVLED